MKIRIPLCLFASLLVTTCVDAYGWRAKAFPADPHNIVITPLIDAFRFHADPVSTWYLDQLDGSLVSRQRFLTFSTAVARATYAAFEYTYIKDGVSRTRIYYSMSGQDEPPTDLPRSGSPLSSYFVEDATRIHAYMAETDESLITWTQTEDDDTGYRHKRDAEFKAVRSIERDIRRGIVTRDGTLQAFVSQPMCDSCEHVMHQLGRLYGVNINVAYLEGNMSQAYRQFRLMLNRYMDTLLVRVNEPRRGGPTPPPPATTMCARIFSQ
ncbi:hypothetical protein ABIE56_001968 [Luteibacter sp. 621]|jgi:hypothetical protein|uniref:hypothetical protein n=1 Tax=Luteibacter sp. 621 TaxID=3373916 RepID=UPI003D208B32